MHWHGGSTRVGKAPSYPDVTHASAAQLTTPTTSSSVVLSVYATAYANVHQVTCTLHRGVWETQIWGSRKPGFGGVEKPVFGGSPGGSRKPDFPPRGPPRGGGPKMAIFRLFQETMYCRLFCQK